MASLRASLQGMLGLTRADVHKDGVRSIDILVWEGCLVVPVPQSQRDPVPLQLQARRAGALAKAE